MSDEKVEVNLDGLARLRAAVWDFTRAEHARMADAVIAELRSRSAVGLFDEVAARHMWDEYCWSIQEGPFDDDEFVGELNVGSVSGAWAHTVRPFVADHVANLPKHALVFLSAYAFDKNVDTDEEDSLGSICVDEIVDLIMDEIRDRAWQRNLDFIGPHREDVIGYEIKGSGTVWSELSDRGEAKDLVAPHTDALIHPGGDLSGLASELVEAFLAAAKEEDDGTILTVLLEDFEDEIRRLLTESDVLPALEDMRKRLLEQLDP